MHLHAPGRLDVACLAEGNSSVILADGASANTVSDIAANFSSILTEAQSSALTQVGAREC